MKYLRIIKREAYIYRNKKPREREREEEYI